MPKVNTPSFTQNISHSITSFIDTDGTSLKTIATAGANDSRITYISISSTDTAAIKAFFYIDNGITNGIISHCEITANSGTNGTTDIVPAISTANFLHRKLDNNANPYFELAANHTLKMKLSSAVAAAKEIKVVVTQEDY